MDELGHLLDELARPAMFKVSPMQVHDGITPPSGGQLWVSPYALMMMWPMPNNIKSFRHEVEIAEAWLDLALQAMEEKATASGTAIDGYLIVALQSAPTTDIEPQIRHLELSPNICRKNVVWPDGNGGFVQLDRVAVLSPRSFVEGAAAGDWPKLDGSETKLLERFISEGGPLPVATADLKDAVSER